jgi:ApaG protein
MVDTLALLFPHVAHTNGVTVRVAVSYLSDQSSPGAGRWFWSYHIRIENGRDEAVQLLARHWIIRDARGNSHEVQGAGVVGDTPRIAPGDSYDYVSGCPLDTSTGSMVGSYHMVDEAGSTFDIAIPAFELVGPSK